jgi:TPR repeat protein
MSTRCPACSSLNVRRSSIRPNEASGKPRLRSPYRCRDCGERFWVISKRANYLAILAAVTIIVATFAWNVAGVRDTPRQESQRPTLNPEGFAEMTKRAEHNDPVAEYNLSQMYARGEGVEANKKEAETWLERAAQHGNVNAQYELGNVLREGSGVVQDYAGAAKWLELAALSGHADAQYALGQMYRTGVGVPADNVRAYIWFNLAAAQNVAGATAQRDVLLRSLTPAQVLEAQTEARRLSQIQTRPATATQ